MQHFCNEIKRGESLNKLEKPSVFVECTHVPVFVQSNNQCELQANHLVWRMTVDIDNYELNVLVAAVALKWFTFRLTVQKSTMHM